MSSRAVKDVSLLLDLSEEVLVHIVKLGRFTLTDVGHLRATCKRVCGFLDRIRDTINEHVVGDLSKYFTYWWWNFDWAASSGHLEVIELLHEDEVKRGRVGIQCTNDAIQSAIKRSDWNMFVFLVRNRKELSVGANLYTRPYPWTNLSDEQLLFLLHEAPSFLAGHALCDAIRGPIRRVNLDMVSELLRYVTNEFIGLLLEAFLCFRETPAVFEFVLAECRKRNLDEQPLALRLFHEAVAQRCGGVDLLDVVLRYFPTTLAKFDATERDLMVKNATDPAVLSRLREFGFKRAVVDKWTEDLVLSVETEGAEIEPNETLVSCLHHQDFVAAEFVAGRYSVSWRYVSSKMMCSGPITALKWLHARGHLDTTPEILLAGGMLTPERVDFLWPLARNEVPQDPYDIGDTVANIVVCGWFNCVIKEGNIAMLRYLCEHLDVVGLYGIAGDATGDPDNAAENGHIDIISYMINVNSRIAPITDSAATQRADAFDLQLRPFDLTNTLEIAVLGGHYRLAHLLIRRVPGLRLSLATACVSRRWSLFHLALASLETAERQKALEDALLESIRKGRIEFVNWFEENEPDVFERCRPMFWESLRSLDTHFWYALLSKHPTCVPTKLHISVVHNLYDILVLERRLGIEILARPVSVWGERTQSVLRLLVDFAVPVILPTPAEMDRLRDQIPSRWQYLTEWIAAGKFVTATTTANQ